jgi:flagellar hook-associated protein 2
MATTGAIGGSQLDVNSLVSQLVAAERATQDKQIARDTSRVTTQISAMGTLMGSMSSFRVALASLKTEDVFAARSAISGNNDVFTAAAGAQAVPGIYSIEVEQLAKAQQLSSDPFEDGAATVVGTGTLTLSLGETSFEVSIADSDATLADIRDAINAASDNPGIRATLVQGTDGSRLVLSSSKTGAENDISISQTGGDGGLARLTYSDSSPGNYSVISEAQDAIVNIAGAQTTSATNTLEGAIDGVTLRLLEETDEEPVTLTVGYDNAAVTNRINNFVNAYNALMSQIGSLRSYNSATGTAGPLLGDSLLNSIESQVRRTISAAVPGQDGAYATLAGIGITTQANGTLSVNSAKLQSALDGNFGAVGKLFGSEQGIAARLFTQMDGQLNSGAAMDTRSKNLVDQQKAIAKRKSDLDARMAVVQTAYLRQFTALDQLLSRMQVTSTYMSQQIESLQNLNKSK